MQSEIEAFAFDFRRHAQSDDHVDDFQNDETDDHVVDNDRADADNLIQKLADIAFERAGRAAVLFNREHACEQGARAQNIARLRKLLARAPDRNKTASDDGQTGSRAPDHPCPCCGGRMIVVETFEGGLAPRASSSREIRINSS